MLFNVADGLKAARNALLVDGLQDVTQSSKTTIDSRGVFMLANDVRERRGPAATGVSFASELNGWSPAAARMG